jgi:hypothetical protein
MFSAKPQLTMRWHCCISAPLIGQKTLSFDDFDSMRRELTKVAGKLVLGNIHVYYGYEMPVTTDASGYNLFVVDQDGNEVSITEGYGTRTPVNSGEFGPVKETIDLDDLV